jgi:hypothetical protein
MNRAVIIHEGEDNGGGAWKCGKSCPKTPTCPHVKQAQDHLQQLLQEDPDAHHEETVVSKDPGKLVVCLKTSI